MYEQILEKGYYRCDGRKIDKYFRERYKWLCDEMIKKIGKPPKGVKYPVWGWHTRNFKHKQPDLRNAGYSYRGDKMVCIELEIPDNQVVLSDFDNWHFVLNNLYLDINCSDKKSYDELYKNLNNLPEKEKEKKIKESWKNIFDIEPVDTEWQRKGSWIQATFWEIKKENIKNVRFFTAK